MMAMTGLELEPGYNNNFLDVRERVQPGAKRTILQQVVTFWYANA
jgi:hypothetical protein